MAMAVLLITLVLFQIFATALCLPLYDKYAILNGGPYPSDFDCPMRILALQFAQHIQPWLSSNQLQQIADALNGSPEKAENCTVTLDEHLLIKPKNNKELYGPIWNDEHDTTKTIYVDGINGDDIINDGTFSKPFLSLQKAINMIEDIKLKSTETERRKIKLRGGKYYLRDTIYFNSNHSNLIITNYDNESVEISGGVALNCKNKWILWNNTKYNAHKSIYQCSIDPSINITSIYGLRINGSRAIRARYPNANPEIDGFGSTLLASKWIPPKYTNPQPEYLYNPRDYPYRNQSGNDWFYYYQLGIGGTACWNYVPKAGFFCSPYNQRGDIVQTPNGLIYNSSILPHSPYNILSNITYSTNPGMIHVWRPNHWASWMFSIGKYNQYNHSIVFERGGFQGGRGDNIGAEFYVENVMEELDYDNEWFFDEEKRILYYYNNKTQTDHPNNLIFEATKLKQFMNFNGTQNNPIQNITIRGLTFRDQAITYMEPHGLPSGGDWSLQRTGAIYMNGCEHFVIEQNIFTRMDGICLSINRYNQNHSIIFNENIWNGATFVSLWGDTEGITFYDDIDENGQITEMGFDGTNLNQPRFINFSYNLVHELGIWEKQSSMLFQAKSCSNTIRGNIFYNGPRAGINFNDGFGGNSTLSHNLLFNTCRESGDHGPFNSWDRQLYVTKVRSNGKDKSVLKANDFFIQNFFIGNYNAQGGIDNDDGSNYYISHDNFLVYAQMGLKSDAGGFSNWHYNNIYAYLNRDCFCIDMGMSSQMNGYIDKFYNNVCIFNNSDVTNYGCMQCNGVNQTQWIYLANNSIHITDVNKISNVGLCGLNESEFQMKYNWDLNTKIYGPPNNTQIIQNAKNMLW